MHRYYYLLALSSANHGGSKISCKPCAGPRFLGKCLRLSVLVWWWWRLGLVNVIHSVTVSEPTHTHTHTAGFRASRKLSCLWGSAEAAHHVGTSEKWPDHSEACARHLRLMNWGTGSLRVIYSTSLKKAMKSHRVLAHHMLNASVLR